MFLEVIVEGEVVKLSSSLEEWTFEGGSRSRWNLDTAIFGCSTVCYINVLESHIVLFCMSGVLCISFHSCLDIYLVWKY